MATSSQSGQSGLQVERARLFADLHKFGDPLLLPNAWDVASAVIIAKYGATAIATSSAGVAWSLGVCDGAYLGADRAAAVIEAIVRNVSIPVSADIEDGYGPTPEAVSITAEAVIRAGAVGVNLEDSSPRGGVALFDSYDQAQRIAAVRAIADRLGRRWLR